MEVARHRGMIANEYITIGSKPCEKLETFQYLGFLLGNENFIYEEIKCRLKAGN